ncbi:MAG: acyl-CoA dehydrogenase [Rhodospirillaceae bacterium TMED8]|nr:acyl-CoA dehydrogenase [Magnetovibrio sp.]OUT49908.1 MAG: acyl-CoA dehydrogenase [Rhodospirillaceae bacterium TMED8]|tara:strand:- start:4431 stop:5591 length:1161 start_codon:yes stop_codon:yes gene_type:complete
MTMDSDTFQNLLTSVRKYVNERLIPLEKEVAENDEVPEDIKHEMAEMGLFGLTVPEEYGGIGLTTEEEVCVSMELGRASPAFRSVFGTNVGIGSQAIVIDGTKEQKLRYLPKIASGEYVTSFALTEPEAGSDAANLQSTARLEGNEYVLNGRKRYITNAPWADVLTVMARTNPDISGHGGISSFIVERTSAGLSFGKPEKKMGQHGAHVCDVIFENCRVPAKNLIGGIEGQGFKTAMKTLDRGRLHLAGVCVGFADRALEVALGYACERKQFKKPISEFQLVQGMLAESKAEIYAGRCMTIDAAKKRDSGQVVATEAACAKMFTSEMCGRVVDRAVQIFGGSGYIADYGVERMYRDARLFRIYEGTTQIQQIVIARNMIRELLDIQ